MMKIVMLMMILRFLAREETFGSEATEEAEDRETPDPILQDPCGRNTCSSATATLEFCVGTTNRNRVVQLAYPILIALLIGITVRLATYKKRLQPGSFPWMLVVTISIRIPNIHCF